MTDPGRTHIVFLLDRSGSMQSIKAETEAGFDAFVERQRSAEGTCTVTLAQFDDRYEVVYADVPVAEVPPLELEPRSMTALLDALARVITETGAALTARPEAERPGSVIVVVMTDGMENASVEWTHDAVRALIRQQTETYSWEFLYMGCDQDAVEVGAGLGIAAGRSITYDRANVDSVMAAASENVSRYREAAVLGAPPSEALDFSDGDRRAARSGGRRRNGA